MPFSLDRFIDLAFSTIICWWRQGWHIFGRAIIVSITLYTLKKQATTRCLLSLEFNTHTPINLSFATWFRICDAVSSRSMRRTSRSML
jgi:hypothetical protein